MRWSSLSLSAGVVLVGALAVALYTTRLASSPPYLLHDEVNFALHAGAVASSGHDPNGRLLPVYFSDPVFPPGRDPVMIYVTALGLLLLPLSDAALRLPTALVGVLSALLMVPVAIRLYGRWYLGLIAAALLALTPAFFMHSRLALSIVYPVPFVLAWLWCLLRFQADPRPRWLAGAAFALGVSVYSYLACVVFVPIYLALSLAWLGWRRKGMGWAVAAFVVAMIPALGWQVLHPERYADIVRAYAVAGTDAHGAVGIVGGLLSPESVRHRLGLYWDFFDPAFLFVSGDTSPINSTRRAGFFVWAMAVFLPIGAYRLARGEQGGLGRLVLAGLITAPLAGVASGHLELNRLLLAAPFGVLVATCGVDALLSADRAWVRAMAALLLASVAWQFAGFHRDYLGRYSAQSGDWFGGNLRDACLWTLEHRPAPGATILIDGSIPYARFYWQWYAKVAGHDDLADVPDYYDRVAGSGDRPVGTLLITAAARAPFELSGAEGWQARSTSRNPDGQAAFTVYEKTQSGE